MQGLSDIIDYYKEVLIQIATPYSTGTGFYLADYHIIVTNEHVVRGNRKVVIMGDSISKQLSQVLYIDPKYDLAFLSPPVVPLSIVNLSTQEVVEGESVIAIGHPFGLKFTATNGIVSNTNHLVNDIRYLQHDAALNPGNSGGPLVERNGMIIGVNTFIIRDGNNIGFSLPSSYLIETISQFKRGGSESSVRCYACANLVFESTIDGKYCPHCGAKVKLPHQVEEYEAVGINKTIEDILTHMGYDVDLTRIGPHQWEVIAGSAKVSITYHEESGLIIGDSFLAQLPKKNIGSIYEYLLRENYRLENLSLSIKGKDIILSLIIYDRYLNVETGAHLLERLFEKSDHYDNILVEQYGALWKEDSTAS